LPPRRNLEHVSMTLHPKERMKVRSEFLDSERPVVSMTPHPRKRVKVGIDLGTEVLHRDVSMTPHPKERMKVSIQHGRWQAHMFP